MCADIFTKAFTVACKWWHACLLISHVKPDLFWANGANTSKSVPVAPAHIERKKVRMPDGANFGIIEFCCGQDSLLGEAAKGTEGCAVLRLTEKEDVTSVRGRELALSFANTCGDYTLLWASMPCAGGCPWQRINVKRPGGMERVKQQYALFRKIWASFVQVAESVLERGGHIAIEWPNNCAFWRWECVCKFVSKHILESAVFHGCAVGLVSRKEGKPIKKAWRICSSLQPLVDVFNSRKCSQDHEHVPCAGSETKSAEHYTVTMVNLIVKVWSDHVRRLMPVTGREKAAGGCTSSRRKRDSPSSSLPRLQSGGAHRAAPAMAAAMASAGPLPPGPGVAPRTRSLAMAGNIADCFVINTGQMTSLREVNVEYLYHATMAAMRLLAPQD